MSHHTPVQESHTNDRTAWKRLALCHALVLAAITLASWLAPTRYLSFFNAVQNAQLYLVGIWAALAIRPLPQRLALFVALSVLLAMFGTRISFLLPPLCISCIWVHWQQAVCLGFISVLCPLLLFRKAGWMLEFAATEPQRSISLPVIFVTAITLFVCVTVIMYRRIASIDVPIMDDGSYPLRVDDHLSRNLWRLLSYLGLAIMVLSAVTTCLRKLHTVVLPFVGLALASMIPVREYGSVAHFAILRHGSIMLVVLISSLLYLRRYGARFVHQANLPTPRPPRATNTRDLA